MRKRLLASVTAILAASTFVAGIASTAQAAPTLPALAVSGNKIVLDGTTTVPELRGGNVLRYEWDDNMGTERVLYPRVSQDWKANIAMVGFSSDRVNANDAAYLAMLDEHVSLAETNHMYVTFAWRSWGQNGAQPTMPDQRAQDALAKLAGRYKGNPHVLFKLQVEPHDVTWATLLPRYNSMVTAIETASAPYHPIIMVPGTNWGRDVHWATTQPVTGSPNIVYATDAYMTQDQFQPQFGVAYDAGLPVFVAEFGAAPDVGMPQADMEALVTWVNARPGIGYTAWMFDYQGGPALVVDNTTFNPTSPYGTYIKADMIQTPPIGTVTPTTAPTTTPPTQTTTVYNDSSFTKSGTGWTRYCCLSTKYMDDDTYSATSGNTATLSFTGTQVKLFAKKASHHGKAAIRIDSGTEVIVDEYAATLAEQQLIYTSPVLTAGAHTVRIRVTGTKNTSSSGTTIAYDRADVLS